MKLRDYQIAALDQTRAALMQDKRVLIVAPTGAGKTVIGSAIIKGAVSKGNKVMFLAHRRELINQPSQKLRDLGVPHGIIMASDPREAIHHPVQVASVQTLIRREVPFRPDIIIIDEAHRARAKSYHDTLERWPYAAVIGLTATPIRQDGKGLGELFDHMVQCPSLSKLTELGHLVPAVAYSKKLDLKGIKTTAGDYNPQELDVRFNQPKLVGDIVQHWRELAADRITVGFAINVAHSQSLCAQFRAAGIPTEHLDGSTPEYDRDAILKRLATGRTRVVWNVGVLTEGWDCPAVSAIILARPTKSLGLYLQMVGRALRPAPGKTDCLILDHAGSCYSHGLPSDEREWTLDPDEMAGRVKKARDAKEKQVSICLQCGRVRSEEPACAGCGFVFVAQPKHIEGRLEKFVRPDVRGLSPDELANRKGVFFRLMEIQTRGRKKDGSPYKPGWAAIAFKRQYGAWPHRGWKTDFESQSMLAERSA